jgi:hypothetical protein
VSLVNPSGPRRWRLVLAGALYGAGIVAAGCSGWGWTHAQALPQHVYASEMQQYGPVLAALVGGQIGAIAFPIVAGFVLPVRWRSRNEARPVIMLLPYALELSAATIGAGIAGASSAVVLTMMVGAAVLIGVIGISVTARRRRALRRAIVTETGMTSSGEVADCTTSETINGIPRWRITVRYNDTQSNTRWYVDHRTSYHPPQVGQPVTVRYDPHRPGDTHRIFIDYTPHVGPTSPMGGRPATNPVFSPPFGAPPDVPTPGSGLFDTWLSQAQQYGVPVTTTYTVLGDRGRAMPGTPGGGLTPDQAASAGANPLGMVGGGAAGTVDLTLDVALPPGPGWTTTMRIAFSTPARRAAIATPGVRLPVLVDPDAHDHIAIDTSRLPVT